MVYVFQLFGRVISGLPVVRFGATLDVM